MLLRASAHGLRLTQGLHLPGGGHSWKEGTGTSLRCRGIWGVAHLCPKSCETASIVPHALVHTSFTVVHPVYRRGRSGLQCPLQTTKKLALGCSKDVSQTTEWATRWCCSVPYDRLSATVLVTIVLRQSAKPHHMRELWKSHPPCVLKPAGMPQ